MGILKNAILVARAIGVIAEMALNSPSSTLGTNSQPEVVQTENSRPQSAEKEKGEPDLSYAAPVVTHLIDENSQTPWAEVELWLPLQARLTPEEDYVKLLLRGIHDLIRQHESQQEAQE